MQPATMRQRLRYWFDNTMARGASALIAWLVVICLAVIVVVSALMVVFDRHTTSLGRAVREIWTNTAAAFELDVREDTIPVVLLSILLAAVGIFFASTLIGLLTAGVSSKIMDLRKGRSLVLEKGHTVILGWSDDVFTIISELVEANRSRGRTAIAVLAQKDRTEMEDEIRDKVGDTGRTRVICRTGDPEDIADVGICNPQAARSVIVLSPPGPTPDQQVIKTLLAVTNAPDRRPMPYHIVTSVADSKNHAAALLAGGGEAEVINADDIAARLIVQTCRQSGLSVVYTDLLDFAGDEIYISPQPQLTGLTFGECLRRFKNSTLIGVQRSDGTVDLKPPMMSQIGPSDQVIVLAEDDDKIDVVDEITPWDDSAIAPLTVTPQASEAALLLSWNRRAPSILRELDAYVSPGSTVDVVASDPAHQATIEAIAEQASNLTFTFIQGDTTDRDVLDGLKPSRYDHIIVLCVDELPGQEADARTLVTLLHLRDMQSKRGERFPIVSEMSDDRNRRLAQVTKADDFIVGNKLISLLQTQLSENRHLAEVFKDLFDPEGAEIYLRPAFNYVALGREINFATVVEAGDRREEIAIGYRLAAQATEAPSYGVTLNPAKDSTMTFGADDKIIVLAEE